MPVQEASSARSLGERYALIQTLGRGGMGVVWRARDTLLERDVAVKEVHLPAELSDRDRAGMHSRVLREARAAARLSDPAVVTVYDVVTEEGTPYIVMELVDGTTLEDIVERDGPLDPAKVAAIGVRLLGALESAHSAGIVHRDVKPANVIVTADGTVKLADFGIASLKDDPKLTATGILLGSPSYMAPEQAQDDDSGPAADLWALGATLYFAVEGEPPFDRGKPIPTLAAVVYDEPRRPQRAGELAPLLARLLNKSPGERPSSAETRRALQSVARRGQASAAITAPLEPRRPAPREPAGAPIQEVGDAEPVAPAAEPVEREGAAAPAGAGIAPATEAEARRAPSEPVATGWSPWTDAAHTSDDAAGYESAPRRRRWGALWPLVASAALVAVLVATLLWGLVEQRADRDDRPRAEGRAQQGAAGGDPDAGAGSDPSETAGGDPDDGDAATPPDAGDDAGESASEDSSATVPSDWLTYVNPELGYEVSYPPGWEVIEDTSGPHSVDLRDPETGTYLRVAATEEPGPDPQATWEDYSQEFGAVHDNYLELGITETTFQGMRASLWEYTYTEGGTDLHAYNLAFVNETYGFALNFQTHAQNWEGSQELWETFKASFRPPATTAGS